MKNRYFLTLSILLSLIIIAGTSYAFYSVTPSGNESSAEIVAKSLEVNYTDGPQITANDLLPGGSVVKTFSIENEGTEDIVYAINIEDITNDFVNKGDILVTLRSNYTNGHIEDISFPSRNRTILKNLTITPNETHSYTMTIEFINDGDQSEDMNKTISGKVQVIENANALKPCEMTNDVNGNGTADIGDEVTCDSESFYVYDNTGDNLKMLAKYNLYVGGYSKDYTHYFYTKKVSGLQNINMKGYHPSDSPYRYGTVSFANSTQHGINYSDYEGSLIRQYVINYHNYLSNNLNINNDADLITMEELENLGCSRTVRRCDSIPSFFLGYSYWTKSVDSATNVWNFPLDGHISPLSSTDQNHFGVRPTITISKSLI